MAVALVVVEAAAKTEAVVAYRLGLGEAPTAVDSAPLACFERRSPCCPRCR